MKKRPPHPSPSAPPKETPAAEFITVAWMLTMLFALMCEIGAVGGYIYTQRVDPDSKSAIVLAIVCFYSALLFGAICLILAPLVWKARQQSPPLGVTVFAVLVGAAPWALLIWMKLVGR